MGLDELNKSLSLNIQKARWRKGFSLNQAAKHLKLDPKEIQAIEEEPIKYPLKDLFKVVKLYEVPQEFLWHLQVHPLGTGTKR